MRRQGRGQGQGCRAPGSRGLQIVRVGLGGGFEHGRWSYLEGVVRKALTYVQLSLSSCALSRKVSLRRILLPFNKYETDRLTLVLKWKNFFFSFNNTLNDRHRIGILNETHVALQHLTT